MHGDALVVDAPALVEAVETGGQEEVDELGGEPGGRGSDPEQGPSVGLVAGLLGELAASGGLGGLGLLVARSHRHGVDKWKAAVLTATVVLFIGGAAAGVILGGRIGDHALIPAAVACVALAVANVLHDRRRRASAVHSASTPDAESGGIASG